MNELEIGQYITREGAYSTVVINNQNKLAYKIFKSYNHPDLDEPDKHLHGEHIINSFRREVFKSEVEAYLKVQESNLLKRFTPTYYGTDEFDKITCSGQDISSHFLTDCCLKLEYIEGDDYKIAGLGGYDIKEDVEKAINMEITSIIQEFKRRGINYLNDASAIVNQKGIPKFIDFGTHRVGDYPHIET